MIDNLVEITKDQLLDQVQNMKYTGHRFVTATCVDNGNGSLDVTYHFDKGFKLTNYRIKVQKEEEVQSVSKIYFCAVLVENEMKELFGLNVKDMVIDYGGHMLLSDEAPGNPMARNQIIIEKKGEKKDV